MQRDEAGDNLTQLSWRVSVSYTNIKRSISFLGTV